MVAALFNFVENPKEPPFLPNTARGICRKGKKVKRNIHEIGNAQPAASMYT